MHHLRLSISYDIMILQHIRLAPAADTMAGHDIEVEHHDVEDEESDPLITSWHTRWKN